MTATWVNVGNIKGPAGLGGSAHKAYQDPLESPNGVRLQFTTPHAYSAQSLSVFLNGLQEFNVVEDSSTTFSFTTSPETGDTIKLCYNLM